MPADPTAVRRADIDAKQDRVGQIITDLGCEAAILLMPAHVAWLCGGLNVRGLIPDTERPGVFTNGRQRWLICAAGDSQRLFDEELDNLGFQLKEWQWPTGRAALLGELVANRRVAVDRPFPQLPLINDRLRPDLRPLTRSDQERYLALGQVVAHALEATARGLEAGDREEEIAGQIAHRLLHRGAEASAVSVAADGRGERYRRHGFTQAAVTRTAVLQATAARDGLYATASRSVSLGPPPAEFKAATEAAVRLSAVYRAASVPEETVGTASEAGRWLLTDGPFEHEWRHGPPAYGAGWFAAEELRRFGQDEPFTVAQTIVWQARVGPAAVVDTVIVGIDGPTAVTPPGQWPFKRITLRGVAYDVPDLLVRP